MNHTFLVQAQALSDDELEARLPRLAARERGATAELIAHLAELDARRLYLAAGYSSMFAYCCEALMLSEHEAPNRIEVARAARRFPVVLEMLMQGAVNLTAVRLLAPHLTPENHLAVLESARGLRKTQVEQLARLSPRPDAPPSIRKLPAPMVPTVPTPVAIPPPTEIAPPPSTQTAAPELPSASAPSTSDPRPAVISSLSPERYKLQMTISGEVLDKLQLAKDLLRHAIPSGDEAALLERALDLLLADALKKKFAVTDRPRTAQAGDSESRHIPAEVKRAVFLRDRGRCVYVATSGRRCDERAFIEFHHVHPYALGGVATAENIELRCRRHNQYEWESEVAALRRLEDDWYRTAGRSGTSGTSTTRTPAIRTPPA